jgi:hypothetical protein
MLLDALGGYGHPNGPEVGASHLVACRSAARSRLSAPAARPRLECRGDHASSSQGPPPSCSSRRLCRRTTPAHSGGLLDGCCALCRTRRCASHRSAAALWGICRARANIDALQHVDITVEANRRPRREGIRLHRVHRLRDQDRAQRVGIPVTSPIRTLIDLVLVLSATELETAINEADRLELVDPQRLRLAAEDRAGQHGVAPLCAVLDRRTFRLTDSELERRFLRPFRRALCGRFRYL